MIRTRVVLLALVAICGFSAVSASAALAAKKGEISKKLASGEVPTLKKFTGSSSTKGLLETAAGSKIQCETTGLKGEILTTISGTATFLFKGCKEGGGNKCKTGSLAAGEIETTVKLSGGAIATESSEAAAGTKDYLINTITPETLTITCSELKIEVKGSLLIPATPEETLSSTYTFAAKGSKGKQTPEMTANQLKTFKHLEAKFGAKGTNENASLEASGLATTFEEAVAFI